MGEAVLNFKRKKIGEILVSMGAITPAEVQLIIEQMALLQRRFGGMR